MEFVIAALLLATLGASAFYYWRSRSSGSTDSVREEARRCTTTEAKRVAIQLAESTDDLDVLWAEWEDRGWSRSGLLYGDVLERKQELGGALSAEERSQLERIRQAQRDAEDLPRITGRMT